MSKTTPLIDFFDQSFHIPHYQRGYRWEAQEVTELLDDLWSFAKNPNNGEFYCLQPLVLKENDNKGFDILDGQQRLTTLYLLLVYLEDKRKEDNYNQTLFTLNYETRKNCEQFLSDKKFTTSTDESNIDFYHICKSYQAIDTWFKDEKHRGAKSKLVPILMDKNGIGNRNVRFIRYEVPKETTNPIEVFIRLNVGKIPLTDAELTKALLLQSDKYPPEELEFNKMKLHNISTEWDRIETTLQDKAFWFFLNDNSNLKSTHIEFIFDLIANKINTEKKYFWNEIDNKPKMPKKYATFLIFSEYLQDLTDNGKLSRIESVEKIWSFVIEYYEYFNEWFQDRILYHYIGFLIATKGNRIIDEIILESKRVSKTKFKVYLEKYIAKIVQNKKSLDKLLYEDENGRKIDYRSIINILLLHNVYTTSKSDKEKPRFPFELYKEQSWSLEHIYARNSQPLTDTQKQKEWLSDHIKSLANTYIDNTCSDLIKRMEDMKRQNEIDNEAFLNLEEETYQVIEKNFEFGNDENVHSIKNMCLLDTSTNSQLNNSVFDVKREKIKKRELDGYYIPICTKNVFLKAYTEFPSTNAYWTKADREGYFNSVKETYDNFIDQLKS